MKQFDELLKSMNLDFFGKGKHKVKSSEHFNNKNGILLDIRSKEEYETLALTLYHHMPVIHIPIEEIPDRIKEIPQNKTIGIFCSSGTRAAIVYAYLRLKGFSWDKIKIIEGGYSGLAAEFSPGKLLKKLTEEKENR
jgi:rhodanese-related sulfurtransferase